MKIWKWIKLFFYITIGVLIIVFNSFVLEHVQYVVGGVIFIHALEEMIIAICKKEIMSESTKFYSDIVLILLSILIMVVIRDNIEYTLIIWGVWSILDEGDHLRECALRIRHKRPAFLHLAEIIAVIVLSSIMIIEPLEHHAHIHVYLLGIEMILEVVFMFSYKRLDAFMLKHFPKLYTRKEKNEIKKSIKEE